MSEHKEFDQLIYEVLCEINEKLCKQDPANILQCIPPDTLPGENNRFGYCPICGAPGEGRGYNGKDICVNDHEYPSEKVLKGPSFPLKAYSEKEIADIKREELPGLEEWTHNNLHIEKDGKNDRLMSAIMGLPAQGGDL